MKNSVTKKDYFVLGLISLPLICGVIIQAIAWYNQEVIGQWIIFVIPIKGLMVDISYGAVGVILCMQPQFFIKFLRKHINIKYDESGANILKLLLRLIGLGVAIIIMMTSCVAIQEIAAAIKIFGQ